MKKQVRKGGSLDKKMRRISRKDAFRKAEQRSTFSVPTARGRKGISISVILAVLRFFPISQRSRCVVQ